MGSNEYGSGRVDTDGCLDFTTVVQLNNVLDEVTECKYCGLRYKMKHHH